MNRACLLATLGAFALGCDLVHTLPAPQMVAASTDPAEIWVFLDPDEGDSSHPASEYGRTVRSVERMVHDPELVEGVRRRGLDLVNVAWEDTGRAEGSALGPSISDLTLQVRRRDAANRFRDALMPVIRPPNFADRTGDVPADRFFLRVGNERRGALSSVPLVEVLRDIGRFAASPASLAGPGRGRLDLLADRDTHFLVSAQAVFLPIPKSGKAQFNPVLFNYQSAPGSPAVLAILVTREGTSITVVENRTQDLTIAGWGQELYFDEGGARASFTAERRSDVTARILAQGGPRTEADRSALGRGADVMALIQVPLVHEHRGVLGGLPAGSAGDSAGSGYGFQFSDDPRSPGGCGPSDATRRLRPGPVRSNVERAVLGHGPQLGPFTEGHGTQLVRDPRFPVRITVQFYKATSDGLVTERDLDAVARNIGSAYEHADVVGSLVVPEGDPVRPTAWQRVPGEWFPW